MSEMSGGAGLVVHALPSTLRLLPLQSWKILPPSPPQPSLSALCPMHTLPAGQEQDVQGQETVCLLTYRSSVNCLFMHIFILLEEFLRFQASWVLLDWKCFKNKFKLHFFVSRHWLGLDILFWCFIGTKSFQISKTEESFTETERKIWKKKQTPGIFF